MQDLHRDPQDMVSMLDTMYKISKIRMGNVPQYLLTHPMPKHRMGYVEDLIHVHSGESYEQFDQFHFQRVKLRLAALTGDPSKLKAQYNRTLRSEGNEEARMYAQYGLALLYFSNGEYDRAISGFHDVNAYFKDRPNLWVDLGRAYLSSGDLAQAYRYFEMARAKDQGNWYATYFLAMALQKKGEIDRAEKLYEQIQGHVPDYPEVYLQLARIAGDRGDAGMSHFYLGLHYFYDVNYSTSRFHFQKARELLKSKDKAAEIEEKLKKMQENS
jgi:predicted Zn-dependent protease